MFMPLFTTFIIFVAFIHLMIRRSDQAKKDADAEFFRKEHEASFVRKKSLDGLDYIVIPLDELPFGAMPGDPEVIHAENTVRKLADKKIVNLTGISNTDLKLKYGTANITPLTEYDTNYLELARVLNKWGKALYQSGRYTEAAQVLSFAVHTGSDVTQTWHLYTDCLRLHLGLDPEESALKLRALIPIAESLNALSKDAILKELEEKTRS